MITQKHHLENAKKKGLDIIGVCENKAYLIYKFKNCGHEQILAKSSVKNHKPKCKTCLETQYKKEAEISGMKLICKSDRARYRVYKILSCGHEVELKVAHVRNKNFKCQKCVIEKFNKEAKIAGLEIIGDGHHAHYRLYKFIDCGHSQDIKVSAVRKGIFQCNQCKSNYWTKPSYIYLVHILASDGFEWLKFGYSNNIKSRIKGYKLLEGCETTVLKCVKTETGKKASTLESNINGLIGGKRLNSTKMKKYHLCSGHSECYPVTMKNELVNLIST